MDPFREAPPNLLTDNLSNQVRALRKQVNELIDANAKLGVRITELESQMSQAELDRKEAPIVRESEP